MKKRFITLVFLISTAILTSPVLAADGAKIGVVNFQKVFQESSAGKLTQKALKSKWNELQKKIDAENEAVKKMSQAFEREALVLSPEKKRDCQRELRDRVNDLKKMNADYSEEFQILQNKELGLIQKDILVLSNEIGQNHGFHLILEAKTAGVLYMAEQVDITDLVIKEYNKKVAQKKQ